VSYQAEPAAHVPEPGAYAPHRTRDLVLTAILVAAIIGMVILIAIMIGLLNRPI
jgi:hypothetical protein